MSKLYKKQSGRFMIEVIIILALLALFTPMIYKAQQEKREAELNKTTTETILQISEAVYAYIQQNASRIAEPELDRDGDPIPVGDITFSVPDDTFVSDMTELPFSDSELKFYLPDGLDLPSIVTNHLFNGYKVSLVRRKLDDGSIAISAMVAAIPRDASENEDLSKIASMLGASGGIVGLFGTDSDKFTGNQGMWEADIADFYAPAKIPVGTVVSNVDYYIPKKITSSAGPAVDNLEYINIGDKLVDPSGDSNEATTMEVSLKMGVSGKNTDERHSFKNIEALYFGPKEEDVICDVDNPAYDPTMAETCLEVKINFDMIGTNKYGDTCAANESCISYNPNGDTAEIYKIEPAGTTMLAGLRLGDYNKEVSTLIPPMILLEVHRDISGNQTINMKNTCPTGYFPASSVIPTKWAATPPASSSITKAAWPFYAMNLKNNTGNTEFFGSDYSCLDVKLSASNMLAHYISGSNVYLRSYIGNEAENIGGSRPSSTKAEFTLSTTSSSTFVDSGANPAPTCSGGGKLQIDLGNYDVCGISNLSSAFACNKELLEVAQKDFNAGQKTSLLRWEFYNPPSYMKSTSSEVDLYATISPVSSNSTFTLKNGTPINVMQTKAWELSPADNSVMYDVYIYCKHAPQAFD